MGTYSPPALLQLIEDLQLDFASLGFSRQFVHEVIEQLAKFLAEVIIHNKVVHEIVQDPVAQGDKGSHVNDHANLIISSNSPTKPSNEHAE
jgi:hypothetical protein